VETTLSILKMLLLGFITFLFVRKGKFPHSTNSEIHSISEFFYFLLFNFYFLFLI